MKYQVQFNPKAIKDFKKLPPDIQKRVNSKITSVMRKAPAFQPGDCSANSQF